MPTVQWVHSNLGLGYMLSRCCIPGQHARATPGPCPYCLFCSGWAPPAAVICGRPYRPHAVMPFLTLLPAAPLPFKFVAHAFARLVRCAPPGAPAPQCTPHSRSPSSPPLHPMYLELHKMQAVDWSRALGKGSGTGSRREAGGAVAAPAGSGGPRVGMPRIKGGGFARATATVHDARALEGVWVWGRARQAAGCGHPWRMARPWRRGSCHPSSSRSLVRCTCCTLHHLWHSTPEVPDAAFVEEGAT